MIGRTSRALVAACVLAAGCGDNLTFPPPRAEVEADPGLVTCLPNLDGQIDSTELEPAIGIAASYVVSPNGRARDVDLTGEVDTEGRRFWDWSLDRAEDRAARVAATRPGDHWFADEFPAATFVTSLDLGGRTLAAYRHDESAISLLGFASATPDPAEGRTLLAYDAPVDLFRFPLSPGASWSTDTRATNAVIRGLPYASNDTYEVVVDATGRLELPHFTLTQAHRVRTTTTARPTLGPEVVTRQVSFLFECLGEVARATSRVGERNPDFTEAAELRRLALPEMP